MSSKKLVPDLTAAIIGSAEHLMIATDSDGTVALFNRAAEISLGYEASEVVGKQSPALWHDAEEVAQRAARLSAELGQEVEVGFEAFVARARIQGVDRGEWTFTRKDGTTFPGYLTVTCLRDPDDAITGYLGVIEDITLRRQQREEVEEAKAFVELLNRNNPDLVFVKDAAFRIVEANPAFLNLYPEQTRDRVIGFTTLEDYDEEEAAAFLAKDREAFATGESQVVEKIAFPDGRTRILNTKKIRYTNRHGEPFILGIARDVTEREQLIQRLRDTNTELEEFAYRTSHDLRSPLVSSIRLLEIVREAIDRSDVQLARESLSHADKSLRSLEQLVQDILVLTETKGRDEEDCDVNIRALVNDALVKVSGMPNYGRLRIEEDLDFDGFIRTKRSRLALIVENMVSNCVKYQDRDQRDSMMKVSTYRQGDAFVLRVEDNGLGIEPEHRAELFGMFKRFHGRVAAGSGLGLYMMKKSAVVLGGDVLYEDPGKGAVFKLVIPFVEAGRERVA